jgi:carbonic anhydrase
MNRRFGIGHVIFAFALVGVFGVASSIFAQQAPAAHGAHWAYSGADGPAHWGDLESDYATCKTGQRQSPIDIKGAKKDSTLAPIQFDYKPSPLKIINNGHTIQINFAPGSSITVNGKSYALVQFHFHKPSEEEIAGKKPSMGIHLVHKDAGGALAVVAVLLKDGSANPAIQTLWANLPNTVDKETEVPNVKFNAADLLPANRNYYTFDGSLTTPPCSEGVTWFVLEATREVSPEQVAAFGNLYPSNARPIQAANSREIRESDFK